MLKNSIYLQSGLCVSKEDKYNLVVNNIETSNVFSIGLDELLNKIKDVIDNEDNPLPEYHEFILEDINDYFKLFIDIDIDKKFNQTYVYKSIIEFKEELINYFESCFLQYNIQYIDIDETKFELHNYIHDNIYFTISNNPNKISIHVFFDNIYVNENSFLSLKNNIKILKNNSNSILIKNIDINPFRKNTQLRFIYSRKSDSIYYHKIYENDINTIDDLKHYLFTYVDESLPHIKLLANSITNKYDNHNNLDKIYPHMVQFKGQNFLSSLEKFLSDNKIYLADEDRNIIKKLKCIKLGYTMDLNLDMLYKCYCLKKDKHKHNHYLLFNAEYILLLKRGKINSCLPKIFTYPRLTSYEISKFIVSLDIIKKINNDIYVFWDNKKWSKLDDENIYAGLALILCEHFDDVLLLNDRDYIANRYFKEAKNTIKSHLSLGYNDLCNNPYIIQFRNGVYDIINSKFYKGNDAKKYIKLSYINIDYKDENDMSESELQSFTKNYNDLKNIINLIIPVDHKLRHVFEANLSSILLAYYKQVITIFYGDTNSGKSTIKELIRSLLSTMFIEIPIDNYTYEVHKDSKKKIGPDAWLGKVDDKLVSFASEADYNETFKLSLIKRMTEPYILARDLRNNKCDQLNTLTQFIDMNHKPKFDGIDTAIFKRIAIININTTYFVDENLDEFIIERASNNRKIIKRDNMLWNRIINKDFTLPLFYLLRCWVLKYHMANINLLSTPELIYNNDEKDNTTSNDDTITLTKFCSGWGLKKQDIRANARDYYDEEIIDISTGTYKIPIPFLRLRNEKSQYIDVKGHTPVLVVLDHVYYRHPVRENCQWYKYKYSEIWDRLSEVI
ncbi:putative NTPase [Alphaentomopoxvirus acuprea]|uniref:Putative NTPase n=1 Tax=Alphaentomopoxvirus acuprea TaxID=62099 RepID=W6JPM2_9POXV|nr:putative NTPase [Anomala cuprea entomopoxvirus]BAO49524.1 putative NTPase [Anomala cuprea entomopoxvirus]